MPWKLNISLNFIIYLSFLFFSFLFVRLENETAEQIDVARKKPAFPHDHQTMVLVNNYTIRIKIIYKSYGQLLVPFCSVECEIDSVIVSKTISFRFGSNVKTYSLGQGSPKLMVCLKNILYNEKWHCNFVYKTTSSSTNKNSEISYTSIHTHAHTTLKCYSVCRSTAEMCWFFTSFPFDLENFEFFIRFRSFCHTSIVL